MGTNLGGTAVERTPSDWILPRRTTCLGFAYTRYGKGLAIGWFSTRALSAWSKASMTKSDLIDLMASDQSTPSERDVEFAVKAMLQQMSDVLAAGERIEIRGFGSFTLHSRRPGIGRNPKTGEAVAIPSRYAPHFKPGKALRERVNAAAGTSLPGRPLGGSND